MLSFPTPWQAELIYEGSKEFTCEFCMNALQSNMAVDFNCGWLSLLTVPVA